MNSTKLAEVYRSRRIAQFEDHPAMPALLKELSPRAVSSLFREIGVTDAAALMAMMPTPSLLHAFDESIWRSPGPGSPETIGVHELVDWLIAWSEIGEEFLVEKVQAMNEDYLTTLLARLIKVESAGRYAVYGEDREVMIKFTEDERERMGPYVLEPTVEEHGDVVADVVRTLWIHDAQKVLRIFDRLTDLPNSDDSTRGSTPTLHDIEYERESFRQAHGFVAAEGARAFFGFAERLTIAEIAALDEYDPETRRYLDTVTRASETPVATPNPVVADDPENDEDRRSEFADASGVLLAEEANTGPLRALLENADLLPRPSALALLQDMRHSKEPTLTAALRRLAGDDLESFHARGRELAYLANVLRWAPANEHDSLNDKDAKEAAAAICNLGFELAENTPAGDLNKEPGLIRMFLLGWNALSAVRGRVIGAFAGALSQNSTLAPWLLHEATAGLADLRRAVEERNFDEAREAVTFLSIVFDSRVCRVVAPLLNTIPRFSTLLEDGSVDQSRWIAGKDDLRLLERVLTAIRLKGIGV